MAAASSGGAEYARDVNCRQDQGERRPLVSERKHKREADYFSAGWPIPHAAKEAARSRSNHSPAL